MISNTLIFMNLRTVNENKPIIYGWMYESNQNLLKVLSLIEGLRRGNNIPPVYVHQAVDVWSEVKNSFKENEFVISKTVLDKNIDYFDGGHHRTIAYHTLDYDFNIKIIPPNNFDIPIGDLKNICRDCTLSINQHHLKGYLDLLKIDKNYIDISEIKEYKSIIEEIELNFRNKIKIEDFKNIVRDYIKI
jgi:hypothetical protein